MLSSKYKWWIRGLSWAAFMYLCLTILYPLAEGTVLTTRHLLIGIPFWGIAGLLWAWITAKYIEKQKVKEERS